MLACDTSGEVECERRERGDREEDPGVDERGEEGGKEKRNSTNACMYKCIRVVKATYIWIHIHVPLP